MNADEYADSVYGYKGLITGLPLPNREGLPGRPRIYISDDAKKLHHALGYVERMLGKVAREDGFTYQSEKMMRARLFQIGNALNANINKEAKRMKAEKGAATRARKRKRNPSGEVHGLLLIVDDGRHVTLCGFKPKCKTVAGSRVCDVWITECAELVDCPDCIEARAT